MGLTSLLTIAVLVPLAYLVLDWLLRRRWEPRGAGEIARQSRSESPPVGDIHDFPVQAVGESHYQEALANLCGGFTTSGHSEVFSAELFPEDSNPYDDQAVRVVIADATVGYLSREDARKFRRGLRADKFSQHCQALLVGGWDRGDGDGGHFGVRLNVDLSGRSNQPRKRKQRSGRADYQQRTPKASRRTAIDQAAADALDL